MVSEGSAKREDVRVGGQRLGTGCSVGETEATDKAWPNVASCVFHFHHLTVLGMLGMLKQTNSKW